MGASSQQATDRLYHFLPLVSNLHVDTASFNIGHDFVVHRPSFNLGSQLRLAYRTQSGDSLSGTFSNQLKGVRNAKTIR